MNQRLTWTARWSVASALAASLALWPLGCAGDDSDEKPADGVEMAKLDYTLKDMNGATVRLSDFKGRPMIINFWATWCAPCRHEIPAFVELVEKYKAERFIVLGVSDDDTAEDLRPFAAEYKMNYPVLVGLGHEDLKAQFAVWSLPVSWFIKADGSVYYKHIGTESKAWFEAKIKALF